MRLSHGTSFRHLKTILENGLAPRGEADSVWEACPSHPDRVYLSNAYAFYFAQNSVGNTDEDALVVEVEVDRKNLFPDEDYMGQVLPKDHWITKKFPNLKERTVYCRDMLDVIDKKQRLEMADESLQLIGNVSHEGVIPPSRITRMAKIPSKEFLQIIMQEFDPIISVMNYHFLGNEHRAFQESLFQRFFYKP